MILVYLACVLFGGWEKGANLTHDLLQVPSDDWITLTTLTGAQQDANANWLFPCAATLTWNFNGSTNRNYTVVLSDQSTAQTINGTRFCAALANDSGDVQNW